MNKFTLILIAVGVAAMIAWNRIAAMPTDKRIKESFDDAEQNKETGFAANLLNNIRQAPIAFLGKLPLQFISLNPLDNNSLVNDPVEKQVLPRQSGSDMFSTLVPASTDLTKQLNDAGVQTYLN